MKREELKHPRVFTDPDWAEGYARRESKRSTRLGREWAIDFKRHGFEGGRIMDVGCGPGTVAIELARAFPDSEVVGIDLSEPLLDIARRSALDAGVSDRTRFEAADVQAIPYEADSFDALVNMNMFHIVEDPIAMLNEMERILVPGGYMMLGDIKRSWIGYLIPIFRTANTREEAEEMVGMSDLRPVYFSDGFLWWGFSSYSPGVSGGE